MTTCYSRDQLGIENRIETILYHTGLRWLSKKKRCKRSIFQFILVFLGFLFDFVCFVLFCFEIDRFVSERKEVPELHRAVRIVSC